MSLFYYDELLLLCVFYVNKTTLKYSSKIMDYKLS